MVLVFFQTAQWVKTHYLMMLWVWGLRLFVRLSKWITIWLQMEQGAWRCRVEQILHTQRVNNCVHIQHQQRIWRSKKKTPNKLELIHFFLLSLKQHNFYNKSRQRFGGSPSVWKQREETWMCCWCFYWWRSAEIRKFYRSCFLLPEQNDNKQF